MVFDKKVGIVHNKYIIKGGEDEVAASEYELLRGKGIQVEQLLFTNPSVGIKALFDFFISIFNTHSFITTYSWLKKNKIDVLHIHNWFYKASPSVIWAARFAKVPVVITLHNYRLLCPSGTLSLNGRPFLDSLHQNFPTTAIKKGAYRNSKPQTFWVAFTNWFHKKLGTWKIPKQYIVLTQNSIDVFKTSKPVIDINRMVIKPNFFSNPHLPVVTKRSNRFLFVGRLSQEKGIKVLLAAFANTAYELTIIGDGPLVEDVRTAAENNQNIEYLGLQPKPVVLQHLADCTALIFPSIWLETFGLTIIEAFATSTPVIASRQGSAALLIVDGYNGLHFQPENVTDLQNMLKAWTLLPDEVKETYRANARKSYEEAYTPDKNFDQLITIYEKAISM